MDTTPGSRVCVAMVSYTHPDQVSDRRIVQLDGQPIAILPSKQAYIVADLLVRGLESLQQVARPHSIDTTSIDTQRLQEALTKANTDKDNLHVALAQAERERDEARDELRRQPAYLTERDGARNMIRILEEQQEQWRTMIDEVFQPGKQPILPYFLRAGQCKIEGVRTLALRYKETQAAVYTHLGDLAALRVKIQALEQSNSKLRNERDEHFRQLQLKIDMYNDKQEDWHNACRARDEAMAEVSELKKRMNSTIQLADKTKCMIERRLKDAHDHITALRDVVRELPVT